MRLPENGAVGTLEHVESAKGKPDGRRRELWAGVTAPGEALPLAFALSVCAGAMIYLRLPFEPSNILAAVLFGVVFVGLTVVLTRVPVVWIRICALLACGVGLGFCAGKFRTIRTAAPAIAAPVGPVMLEGWVLGVEPARRGVRLRILPHAIAGMATGELPEAVRLTHTLDLKVAPGRFVRCWSVVRPPPGPAVPGDYDFRRQAWFQGLGGVGYVQGRCRGGVLGAPESGRSTRALKIAAYRRRLAEYTNQVSGARAGGFAAALVSGDRSYMASEDQETLRASGLAHLLAISGLHLGIVGGLVYLLFRRALAFVAPLSLRFPVQKLAAIAALLGVTVYLIISGASVSTQRAFIMSVVFFAAILIDRPALSLRSFSIALLLVVLITPESVFAPGFQMSFAATGVLIAIYEAWARRRIGRTYGILGRGWFAAKSIAVTSIAASIATAPFAIFHFERLAPLGLIANLAAMPVVSLASVPSAGLAMVLAPFGMAEYGLRLFGGSLEIVLGIATWAEQAGGQFDYPLKLMPAGALGAFTLMLISVVLFRRWLRPAAIVISGLFGVAWWALVPLTPVYWAPSGEVFINTLNSEYERIDFIDGDALGPLRLRRVRDGAPCTEAECLYMTQAGAVVKLIRGEFDVGMCGSAESVPEIILALNEPSDAVRQACPDILYWNEVVTSGGASVSLDRKGIRRRHARTCSARPWRRCEPE